MISPRVVLLQWGRCPQFVCGFLAASILLTSGLQGLMQFPARSQSLETPLSLIQSAPPASSLVSGTASVQKFPQAAHPAATQAQDPLHSAYPIPWDMIWQNQTQATQTGKVVSLRHVSDAIASPDGQRNAHSEISLELHPAVTQSRVVSQLIITDAKGAQIQKIASSMHLGEGMVKETSETAVGTLSILMPATWSKDGQQLLARQFEAVFGSDVSSDYALVWNRNTQQVKTVAPVPQDYDTAILLGWSDRNPDQILFRTAILGEPNTALVAVNDDGITVASEGDRILSLSQKVMTAPAAPQARR